MPTPKDTPNRSRSSSAWRYAPCAIWTTASAAVSRRHSHGRTPRPATLEVPLSKRHIDRLAGPIPLGPHKLATRAVPAGQAGHGLSSRQGRGVGSFAGDGAQSTDARWGHGGIAERGQVARLASIANRCRCPAPSLTPARRLPAPRRRS